MKCHYCDATEDLELIDLGDSPGGESEPPYALGDGWMCTECRRGVHGPTLEEIAEEWGVNWRDSD